jgi:hypothetical protein
MFDNVTWVITQCIYKHYLHFHLKDISKMETAGYVEKWVPIRLTILITYQKKHLSCTLLSEPKYHLILILELSTVIILSIIELKEFCAPRNLLQIRVSERILNRNSIISNHCSLLYIYLIYNKIVMKTVMSVDVIKLISEFRTEERCPD